MLVFLLFFFLNFWLCWVFTAAQAFLWLCELELLSSCHMQASHCDGLSCCGAWALGHVGLIVAAHGLSCSAACGIFPDQGSNPCLPHWQVDASPLSHQGNPREGFNDSLWRREESHIWHQNLEWRPMPRASVLFWALCQWFWIVTST